MTRKITPKVVEATFCMVDDLSGRGAAVQNAMFAALQAAQAEGVTDPDTLRATMLAARDMVVSGRPSMIDAAVKRAAEGWAVICSPRALLRQWLVDLPEGVMGVIQANFLAISGAPDSERSRVYAHGADKHGGVPA